MDGSLSKTGYQKKLFDVFGWLFNSAKKAPNSIVRKKTKNCKQYIFSRCKYSCSKEEICKITCDVTALQNFFSISIEAHSANFLPFPFCHAKVPVRRYYLKQDHLLTLSKLVETLKLLKCPQLYFERVAPVKVVQLRLESLLSRVNKNYVSLKKFSQ